MTESIHKRPGERQDDREQFAPSSDLGAENRASKPELDPRIAGALANLAERAGLSESELRDAAQDGILRRDTAPRRRSRVPSPAPDPRNRKARRVSARMTQDIVRGTAKGGGGRSAKTFAQAYGADSKPTRKRSYEKDAAQDAKRLARQLQWVKDNELKGKPLAFVPHELWCLMRAIATDHSGACAKHWLRHCPNKVFAAAVRQVALIPTREPDDASTGERHDHFTWRDDRARDVVALGALLIGMQSAVRSANWHGRRWPAVVTGLCRNLILVALEPDERYRKSRQYLTGIYGWGGRWNSSPFARGKKTGPGCGILIALEQCGALYRNPWQGQGYATRSGFQPNQYWITSALPEYGVDDAETAQRCERVSAEIRIEIAEAGEYRPGPFDIYASPGPAPPALAQVG